MPMNMKNMAPPMEAVFLMVWANSFRFMRRMTATMMMAPITPIPAASVTVQIPPQMEPMTTIIRMRNAHTPLRLERRSFQEAFGISGALSGFLRI